MHICTMDAGEGRDVAVVDMWALVRKRVQWECLWQGTMHKQVWRGAVVPVTMKDTQVLEMTKGVTVMTRTRNLAKTLMNKL